MQDIDNMIATTTDTKELRRAMSVKLYHSGMKNSEVASFLGCSRQFVSKWIKIYQESDAKGLALGYKGSNGYLTQEQKTQILEWIKQHDTIALEELIQYIENEFQVTYKSLQSYYDLLSQGGMSYHKTAPTNPKRNKTQIIEKRELIKKKSWKNKKK